MAILSKIRDRSGFLIIVIGLAMFSFVVSPKDIIEFFSNKNSDVIGEVNGKEITYKEFATRVENAKNQGGKTSYGTLTIENNIWNQMVSERIYESKLEEAGVVVGEGEIWNSIISSSQVTNSPQFKDDQGVFSEDLLKEYIANLEVDNTTAGKSRLQAWLNYEKAVKQNLLTQTYNKLVNIGFTVQEEEATNDYILKNTKVTADYVYLPFTSISNADVKVSKEDVKEYVQEHKNQFETEASRDLKVVKFSFQASKEDENQIKQDLASLIEDSEEYNRITKDTELVKGFKNTDDAYVYAEEVGSDLPIGNGFQTSNEISTVIKEEITKGKKGNVVGPYKSSKYYKLTKLIDTQKLPDSVKASHILINYVGAQSAQENTTRTFADAQKLADSILVVVKKSSEKFADLAQNYSIDPGSASKGGDLGWFAYRNMVTEFRDYCFENKKGDIGIVKTNYGLHIIKIENQKDFNQAYKLVTISRKIEASEASENKTFEAAETFANALRNGEDFDVLAAKNKYAVSPVNGLKELDVYVGAVGENRSIVKWAFEEDLEINAIKRFDLDEKGYAVVSLSGKQEKGLESVNTAFSTVEPILVNQKKAEILKSKMEAANLEEIAKINNVAVATFKDVTIGAPTISGVGRETAIVSAANASTVNSLVKQVVGEKGVFAFVTKSVNKPSKEEVKLNVKSASSLLKSSVSRELFTGLKENVVIKDYRASRY